MSKHKSRQPRPPKQWDPRTKTPVPPPISGIAHDGSIVVHPERFAELVRLGVIDHHGRRLPQSGGTT